MESNDSPEIPDRGETSDIPSLPSGAEMITPKQREQPLYLMLASTGSQCSFIRRGVEWCREIDAKSRIKRNGQALLVYKP